MDRHKLRYAKGRQAYFKVKLENNICHLPIKYFIFRQFAERLLEIGREKGTRIQDPLAVFQCPQPNPAADFHTCKSKSLEKGKAPLQLILCIVTDQCPGLYGKKNRSK